MNALTPPGLIIAGPRSGSGKTTVTLGLLRALSRQGVAVGSAKCGPDYIDPAFHARATGRRSFNLDTWAMAPSQVAALARAAGADCDLVICEGLMGLFDGVPAPAGQTGSSADVAATLGWPVILVHDATGQAQSAAAQIVGCLRFDPRLRVAGVILNRIGSDRHRRLVADALAPHDIPILGCLPKAEHLTLPERHLGLVQAGETADLEARLEAFADFVSAHIDLDAVRALAQPLQVPGFGPASAVLPPPGQRIAVAQDAAFSFIYPHALQSWAEAGAEVSFFSPLAGEPPPDACDSCWLPGGYPELHADTLAAASGFLLGLRRFAQTRSIHGECGGYMVLGETLADAAGTEHRMAGLLSVATSFARRKLHLGYRDAELMADGPLGRRGTRLRGHEFHYATVLSEGADAEFAQVRDAYGSEPVRAGARRGNVTGSFFHAIAVAPSG